MAATNLTLSPAFTTIVSLSLASNSTRGGMISLLHVTASDCSEGSEIVPAEFFAIILKEKQQKQCVSFSLI